MGRNLRPVERLLVPAVEETIEALDAGEIDAGAVRLAERYAHDIDEAAVISATLTKALRDLHAVDVDLHDRFLALATRIEETTVLATIGPKLLAALEQLGATPAARAKLRGGGAAGGGSSWLDNMRNARGA